MRSVMLRHPQVTAVLFGVAFGLILFSLGGRASMDPINVIGAGIFGGFAGVGARRGLAMQPASGGSSDADPRP